MTQGHKDGIKAITDKIRTNTENNTCNTEDIAHLCDMIQEAIDAEPSE